jgi:hypothetical protein
MAFTLANWTCISASLNEGQETVTPFGGSPTVLNAPNIFIYGSPNDAVATITGSGYFNAQAYSLAVGDWIIGNGTDAAFLVNVLSITAGVVVVSSIGSSIAPFEVTGNFLVSPSQTGITAHAGGGQASATPLTYQVNNVTTVATAGDSVALPASLVSGSSLSVTVINSSSKVMQVFGAGTDTINGVATATGVPQQPNSIVVYTSAVLGAWDALGLPFGFSGAYETVSAASGLTAHAGGTQAAALALTSAINNVSTVATAGDSVRLPASAAGMEISITNSGVASMQVYGAGTDTINGVATATGVAQLPGQTVVYTCAIAGNWLANGVGASLNPNPILFASVPITAAQFNGMYAAPVLLVAAPGANKMIVVETMELIMTFVSADYAAGGVVAAQYDSTAHGAGVLATNSEAAADFFAAASTVFQFIGTSGNTVGALPFSTCANKGLYLSNPTAAFTTGDSTWVVKVYYRVINLVGAL